jgi:hypothetical protein
LAVGWLVGLAAVAGLPVGAYFVGLLGAGAGIGGVLLAGLAAVSAWRPGLFGAVLGLVVLRAVAAALPGLLDSHVLFLRGGAGAGGVIGGQVDEWEVHAVEPFQGVRESLVPVLVAAPGTGGCLDG